MTKRDEVVAAKRALAAVPFTEEEAKTVQRVAAAVWEYIGYDAIQATAEAGEGDSVDRDVVLELVIDANRLEDHLKRSSMGRRAYPELATKVRKLLDQRGGYDALQRLILPAFPFRRYGM